MPVDSPAYSRAGTIFRYSIGELALYDMLISIREKLIRIGAPAAVVALVMTLAFVFTPGRGFSPSVFAIHAPEESHDVVLSEHLDTGSRDAFLSNHDLSSFHDPSLSEHYGVCSHDVFLSSHDQSGSHDPQLSQHFDIGSHDAVISNHDDSVSHDPLISDHFSSAFL